MTGPLDERAQGARRLQNKVSIITGAGQGIGAATARRFAEEGAVVVLADQAEAGIARVKDELEAHGTQVDQFLGDLSDWDTCHRLMAETVERFSRIDVLVNNVGGSVRHQPFEEFTEAQMHQEMDRSFWPTMYCLRAVLPQMVAQSSGNVVNLGSTAVDGILRGPYSAAKGAVMALTTSVAKEVADKGIRINCVAPHATAVADRVTPRNADEGRLSVEEEARRAEWNRRWFGEGAHAGVDFIPMKRFGTPEEQAAVIAFLASDDASFMTGQVLWVGS
jgi:dihydroxycyclohexadiene carboxylate dehydrogenase